MLPRSSEMTFFILMEKTLHFPPQHDHHIYQVEKKERVCQKREFAPRSVSCEVSRCEF